MSYLAVFALFVFVIGCLLSLRSRAEVKELPLTQRRIQCWVKVC